MFACRNYNKSSAQLQFGIFAGPQIVTSSRYTIDGTKQPNTTNMGSSSA